MPWSSSMPTGCSTATTRRCGCSASSRANMRSDIPLHAFAPPTQADGRPSAQVFAEGRLKVIESGVERFDWQFQRPDGETLVLDVILHAVQMGGGEIVHGILRDMTAKRLRGARARDCASGGGKQPAASVAAGRAYRTAQPLAVSGRGPAPDRRGPRSRTVSACCASTSTTSGGSTRRWARAVGDGALRAVGERLRRLRRLGGLAGPPGERRIRVAPDRLQRRGGRRDRRPPGRRAGRAAHGRRSAVQRDGQRRRCLSWHAGAEPRRR